MAAKSVNTRCKCKECGRDDATTATKTATAAAAAVATATEQR